MSRDGARVEARGGGRSEGARAMSGAASSLTGEEQFRRYARLRRREVACLSIASLPFFAAFTVAMFVLFLFSWSFVAWALEEAVCAGLGLGAQTPELCSFLSGVGGSLMTDERAPLAGVMAVIALLSVLYLSALSLAFRRSIPFYAVFLFLIAAELSLAAQWGLFAAEAGPPVAAARRPPAAFLGLGAVVGLASLPFVGAALAARLAVGRHARRPLRSPLRWPLRWPVLRSALALARFRLLSWATVAAALDIALRYAAFLIALLAIFWASAGSTALSGPLGAQHADSALGAVITVAIALGAIFALMAMTAGAHHVRATAADLALAGAAAVLIAAHLAGAGGEQNPDFFVQMAALALLAYLLVFGRRVVFWLSELVVQTIRRYTIKPAGRFLEDPRAAPILLLRSFQDDRETVRANNSMIAAPFRALRRRVYVEEIVAEVAFQQGPLIAVADPGARRPPLGAARENLSDDAWRPYVARLIERSARIVVILGQTPGLLWEIDQIAARGALRRTIFIVPRRDVDAAVLVGRVPALAPLRGAAEAARDARVIFFDPDPDPDPDTAPDPGRGAWTALADRALGEFRFREMIRFAFSAAAGPGAA